MVKYDTQRFKFFADNPDFRQGLAGRAFGLGCESGGATKDMEGPPTNMAFPS